ncbi:hypothetical protein MNBD_GAMMA01-382 [hydrothermal vent metagenome]|uniref:HTH cro/C1-type domain-containing protein n=1 Tax=hydrothermal vent metagenome TaxID=652676 RepID=A0A3B0VNU5_9ZZZZ
MQSENNNKNDLRIIRKEKGLSLADVAGRLNLTPDVIRKLEHSEFGTLGAYTYVRGYINHYAELLEVDAKKYIQLIPKAEIEVALINTNTHLSKGIKLKRHSKNMASYAIGTFIVIAVSFSGWYLLKNYSSIGRSNIEIVKTNDLEITPQRNIENISSDTGKNTDAGSNDMEKSFHYSSLIPPNVENIANEIAIPSQQPEIAPEIETAIKLTYSIKIEATETSWVKVEHLDGTKLHNDLLSSGMIQLESDQPVHFRIGNEKKVTVTINDEVIDLSKFSKQDIADFNWPIDS